MIDRRAQRDNSISIFRIIAVVCAVCVLVYFIFALATGIEPIATVIACALLCIFLCIFIYLTLNPDSVRSQYTEETLSVASAMLEDIKGGLTQESALLVCRRILPETRAMTVAITDESNVLACAGEFEEKLLPDSPIHTLATRYVIEHGIVQSFNRVMDVVGSDGSHNHVPAGIIAPIKVGDRTVGTLKFYYKTPRAVDRTQYALASGFAEILSTQLAIHELEVQKELTARAEVRALQAQINPHFLYNSFYHLYRMAKMEDTDGIAEMSLKLSSYYRYITRSAQPVVTLAMEYQNIVDYTEIQTIRFGDRITVQLQPLPEPYRELAVPRFILQPLFENAYNHGVEKMENGLIQLRFKMEPEFLNIYVENNGSCPDAELEKLTQYLNSTDRKAECTALKNVKLRMQMQGGDLQVSHGTLGGFGVSLRLPLHSAHSLNTEQQNGQPKKEETSHADTVACG